MTLCVRWVKEFNRNLGNTVRFQSDAKFQQVNLAGSRSREVARYAVLSQFLALVLYKDIVLPV